MLIAVLAIEKLRPQLELASQYVHYTFREESVRMQFETNCSLNKPAGNKSPYKTLLRNRAKQTSWMNQSIISEKVCW